MRLGWTKGILYGIVTRMQEVSATVLHDCLPTMELQQHKYPVKGINAGSPLQAPATEGRQRTAGGHICARARGGWG